MAEPHPGYFTSSLAEIDPAVQAALDGELKRQQDGIELIASENIVSLAVLEAQGSVMTNKTVEGYPGRRYYGGAEYADVIERLAIERACELFGCKYANLQPHSGSQANLAVFLALVQPGDTVLSMSLSAGGHLSHGAKPNLTGKWFDIVSYGVRRQDGRIDMDEVRKLAEEHRPKLIIAGGSAYARAIDFKAMREAADAVGAYLLVDIAHFAGLVAAGLYPDPFPHAHVVTTTTYKNLRGPRGGVVLTNDEALAKKIDSATFPGVQGSVMLHVMAGKAVCLGEALRPEFAAYARRMLDNAHALAKALMDGGVDIVSGGTDTPLMLADLRPKGLTGDVASAALERAGLTCNKNAVPFDPEKPMVTSGLRFGVAAGTTRGFGPTEFTHVGDLIVQVLDALKSDDPEPVIASVRAHVLALAEAFPIYPVVPSA
ncbi:MAG: serine hydroxymethyltransferase [Alphaproteobacteria bacterium]